MLPPSESDTTWAVDVVDGGAALMLAILLAHDQTVLYLSGRAVHRAAGGYRGEGKSDARDAAIIADQARMRRDLAAIRPGDEITVELKMLTARRADLVADRTRALNRVRAENAVTSCDTYSCMRPPSRSRRSGRTGSTAPCHRSAQQRASVPVDQPTHLELRQVPELLATLAGCEHEPHRLRQQTPGDESERQRRRLVQPPAPPVSVSGASGVPQAPRHDGPQPSLSTWVEAPAP